MFSPEMMPNEKKKKKNVKTRYYLFQTNDQFDIQQ